MYTGNIYMTNLMVLKIQGVKFSGKKSRSVVYQGVWFFENIKECGISRSVVYQGVRYIKECTPGPPVGKGRGARF